MSLTAAAVASPRQLYQGQPGTTVGTLYTAPAASANVTSPSATAYITEIVIANTTASAATISLYIGGSAAANAILSGLSIAANDTKILTGLKTAIPAGATIQALQGTAAAITLTLSGVEVQ